MKADVAINTFVELYGFPKWEKDGQSIEEIKRIWEEELKGYSDEQIKIACYKLFRYRKTMTFPTISQLIAMLYDEEKTKDYEEYKIIGKSYCPELELFKQVNPSCSFGKFSNSFRNMINDFKIYYPEMRDLTFANGLLESMKNNGWWSNKIREYL